MFNMLKLSVTLLTKILHRSSRASIRSPIHFRPLLELLEDRLAPTVYTWTHEGLTSNWSDPGNWTHPLNGLQVRGAPFSGADVNFGGAGPHGNDNSTVDAAALPAVLGDYPTPAGMLGRLTINGYSETITLGQNLTVTDRFDQSSGTVAGPFSLTLLASNTWNGGTQRGDGTTDSQLVVQAGATLTVSASVTLNHRARLRS